MSENQIIKKLQFKDEGQTVLMMNVPQEYKQIAAAFSGDVHNSPELDHYEFVQVFGINNAELKASAQTATAYVTDDGLFWLCYPKKSSKRYKGSVCSRTTVASMLAEEGFEPVRQVAIDEDWSALRFRKPENIKTMKRKSAVTEEGKKRLSKES